MSLFDNQRIKAPDIVGGLQHFPSDRNAGSRAIADRNSHRRYKAGGYAREPVPGRVPEGKRRSAHGPELVGQRPENACAFPAHPRRPFQCLNPRSAEGGPDPSLTRYRLNRPVFGFSFNAFERAVPSSPSISSTTASRLAESGRSSRLLTRSSMTDSSQARS